MKSGQARWCPYRLQPLSYVRLRFRYAGDLYLKYLELGSMDFALAIGHSFAFLTWERVFHKIESQVCLKQMLLKSDFATAVFSRELSLFVLSKNGR